MSNQNINGYTTEQVALNDADYFDIDAYLGVDDYESRKVTMGTIKAHVLAGATNIYNTSGTLTGNRTIDADGNGFVVTNSFLFSLQDQVGNSISSNIEEFAISCGATNNEDKFLGYNLQYQLNWTSNTSYTALVPLGFVVANGTTANRPTQGITGQFYLDTTLGKPIWFNGTNWVDATGIVV